MAPSRFRRKEIMWLLTIFLMGNKHSVRSTPYANFQYNSNGMTLHNSTGIEKSSICHIHKKQIVGTKHNARRMKSIGSQCPKLALLRAFTGSSNVLLVAIGM